MKFFYISKKFFIINMGIHTMIIYFALCLLINGYKNIYFHNVCLRIIYEKYCFQKLFLVRKGSYAYFWSVSFMDMLF